MGNFILGILGILFLVAIYFILTHLRPLTDEEIESLAGKRRYNQIRFYYSFENQELTPDKDFKKRMNSTGRFYHINESLIMTDDVVLGKTSESHFRKYIVYMVFARIIGTVLAQFLLIPAARVISLIAGSL
jgi:hypothetical protein